MFNDIINIAAAKRPLIHNITNVVSATDQANATLIVGGSPIMAADPNEAAEVCAIADGLVLNTGILSESAHSAMLKAAEVAYSRAIPVVLDPVGAGVSAFRTNAILDIIDKAKISAVHLNASELNALCTGMKNLGGVDVHGDFSLDSIIANARKLSDRLGAVIAVTGAEDIVCGSGKCAVVRNGSPMLKRITASGCMLGSVMGVFCAAAPNRLFDAVLAAVTLFGVSSQRAWKDGMGLGTYKTKFFDELTYPDFGGADIEYK